MITLIPTSVAQSIFCPLIGKSANNELEELVVTEFEEPSCHLSGRTVENQENHIQEGFFDFI
jgi:hypothetical protein